VTLNHERQGSDNVYGRRLVVKRKTEIDRQTDRGYIQIKTPQPEKPLYTMPLMLPKSDGQKHQNQTQQYHDENRDLTHHQYKCIDHSYDCNNGQTADKLNSIL